MIADEFEEDGEGHGGDSKKKYMMGPIFNDQAGMINIMLREPLLRFGLVGYDTVFATRSTKKKEGPKEGKMLRSVKDIIGYVISAEDGEIGRCRDFLFDDEWWTVRYMVVDTGKWLPGRKVLVSPIALGDPDWLNRKFPVKMTKEQIAGAPSIEEDAPVSRRYERQYFGHYYWPYYWSGADTWGATPYPPPMPVHGAKEDQEPHEDPEESHLRSVKEVIRYDIRGTDGEVGHVEDYIVDDETWTIRYMVADTRKWLPGRKVLVAPQWIKGVEWAERTVDVDLTVKAVKESPEYDPSAPVNREYEMRLYDYYGRPVYWR